MTLGKMGGGGGENPFTLLQAKCFVCGGVAGWWPQISLYPHSIKLSSQHFRNQVMSLKIPHFIAGRGGGGGGQIWQNQSLLASTWGRAVAE